MQKKHTALDQMMRKERELLARVLESRTFMQGVALRREIEQLLVQPEQTEPVEICPDCGSKVTWYHCREGTRVICADKCQGYKVIASRGRRDECFTKGDL